MASFNPMQIQLEPQPHPDALGEALSRGLNRAAHRRRPWSAPQLFIGAAVSLGLLPLMIWPKRFYDSSVFERHQLEIFMQWLGGRLGADKTNAANSALDRARYSPWLRNFYWLMFVVLAIALVHRFLRTGFDVMSVIHTAYTPPLWHSKELTITHWQIALGMTFLLYALGIARHSSRMGKFVRELSPLLNDAESEPIQWHTSGTGLRPLWLAAGILGTILGAWWAIPASIAGAMHMRYLKRSNPQLRRDLGKYVQETLRSEAAS